MLHYKIITKTLILGDLHLKNNLSYTEYISDGRVSEKKEILDFIIDQSEDCQHVVFLGDFFDAKNNSSQVNNVSINNETNSIKPQNLSTSPVQKIRGLTPKINGEAFDIKRCYQFRASTIKKLNQLKGESDNINIYLNEIIDAAICFYHDSVFNKK